jgi:trigger factor
MAVPESEIDGQLSALQERFSDFNNIEDRAAEMADFAVIDYTSTIEGLPTEEFLGKPAGYLTGREGFWVRLDEKAFLPGFVIQLVGMNPQDSRVITLTLPEDFPEKELRGKEITFQTTLKELKTAVLPVLDDELANRLVPGKTLEDIRTIIRENLQEDRDRKINDQKVNQIVTTLNSMVQFDLPAELVISETQNQADALVKRGVQSGMTQAQIESQQTEIFEQAGEQAITQLRTNFILQEIARMENITISDSELTGHLMQIAQSRKEAPKKVFKEMQRSGRIPSIRSSMAIGKTIDFLLEHANVIEIQESNQND